MRLTVEDEEEELTVPSLLLEPERTVPVVPLEFEEEPEEERTELPLVERVRVLEFTVPELVEDWPAPMLMLGLLCLLE